MLEKQHIMDILSIGAGATRRNIFTTGAALAVLGMAPVPPNPDVALLALCTEFHRQNALGYDEANPAWEAAMGERYEVYTKLEDMVPVTEAGHLAKARVAVVLLAENDYEEFSGNPDARFALVTLRDLVGRA